MTMPSLRIHSILEFFDFAENFFRTHEYCEYEERLSLRKLPENVTSRGVFPDDDAKELAQACGFTGPNDHFRAWLALRVNRQLSTNPELREIDKRRI